MNLSHNTILITGGGSGIGLALAEQFLEIRAGRANTLYLIPGIFPFLAEKNDLKPIKKY